MGDELNSPEAVEAPPVKKVRESPRGIATSRVDDKGRMKVPAAFKQYLESLDERTLFITSLDLRTVRIYPISIWRENEILLENEKEESEEAAEVSFLATDLGQESEMDSQGRVLLPSEMRKTLGLESKPVFMNAYKGRINVFGKEVYEEMRAQARARAAEKLRKLEQKGLK